MKQHPYYDHPPFLYLMLVPMIFVVRVVWRLQGRDETVLLPAPRPKQHVLMTRDTITLHEEVWCTFESRAELAEARDALNRLYEGVRSFWGKDDEPPRFAKNPAAFSEYMKNHGQPYGLPGGRWE